MKDPIILATYSVPNFLETPIASIRQVEASNKAGLGSLRARLRVVVR